MPSAPHLRVMAIGAEEEIVLKGLLRFWSSNEE